MEVKFTTELKDVKSFYMESEGVINLLDDMLLARDELFERRLKDGIKQHKRVLPHQS